MQAGGVLSENARNDNRIVAFVSNCNEKYLVAVVACPVVGLTITVDHPECVPVWTNVLYTVHIDVPAYILLLL